jgi:hypothetical protein
MSERLVNLETFETVVRHLSKMVFTALKQAALAQRLLAASVPLDPAKVQECRQEIDRDFATLMQQVDQSSVDILSELLHNYQGTIQ